LLIDAGTTQGIKIGETVFALGDVPIGSISDVYPNSAKVVLFSNPGTTTQVIIPSASSALDTSVTSTSTGSTSSPQTSTGQATKISSGNVSTQIVGRGGGNFEIVIPKDSVLQEGAQAVLPGINAYVLGIVQKVISDPRNSVTKVLLTSPVNIEELKFVEVQQ
jgi:cell shape-determining protein MreC